MTAYRYPRHETRIYKAMNDYFGWSGSLEGRRGYRKRLREIQKSRLLKKAGAFTGC